MSSSIDNQAYGMLSIGHQFVLLKNFSCWWLWDYAMKQKPADRRNWRRVTKSRFAQISLDVSEFTGYATLFCIDEVREPLWENCCGQRVCLADRGYSWMQHFPVGARYSITTVFDAHDEIVEWYIDICNRHYLDKEGRVWYEDLYLDLVVSFAGEVELLDADELDEALRLNQVSSVEYEIAWREASGLMTAIEQDMFPLLWLLPSHKERFIGLV
jgi:uncharacterized protein